MPDLLDVAQLGPLQLPNRLVMAPLTRNRADEDRAPHKLNATYYAQRATAGLIISEATQVSEMGIGYPGTPGIHSEKQKAGWKLVTDAVHKKGGRIFAQLWFCGRASHSSLLPGGAKPVSASAIAPDGQVTTAQGTQVDHETPRALEADELPGIVEDYRHAAKVAKEAGFDGVEIHAANGYLLDQFLRSGSNQRADDFGGSIENRCRFPLNVVAAACDVFGSERVGVRISPTGTFGSMHDDNPQETFGHFARQLDKLGVVYIHVNEPGGSDFKRGAGEFGTENLRDDFSRTLIACGDYTHDRAQEKIREGKADLVAFGRTYIANPDLVERFTRGADLNDPEQSTFYGGGTAGYTDYPFLSETGSTVSA